MAGIRDVAIKAGVAPSTVSRVLNGSGYVATETRRVVEQAMKELDYMPNEMARNLFKKRTGLIALVVPDIGHPFFAEIARHIETELYENGYKTLICNTIEKSNREKEYLEMLRRQMVDGIIMASHSLDIEEYGSSGKPLVALDRFLGKQIPCIGADHVTGGLLAAKKLLSNKCKSVVQLIGSQTVNTPAHERHYIFEKTLKEAGIHVCTIEMPWNLFNFDSYIHLAQEVTAAHPHMDGLFATDLIAIAFLKTLTAAGKKIPADVRIVGYDGGLAADCCIPLLTTVVQPHKNLAHETVKRLLAVINGEKGLPMRVSLDVTLREGETTLR